MTYPRPLSDRERAILDHLLRADAPGAAELRAQVQSAQVVDMCECGCASIDISVDRGATMPATLTSRLPIQAFSKERVDPQRVFDLLLWCEDGWLAGVEVVYFDKPIPTEFPPPDSFNAAIPYEEPTATDRH